jgi:hypothetical protein
VAFNVGLHVDGAWQPDHRAHDQNQDVI